MASLTWPNASLITSTHSLLPSFSSSFAVKLKEDAAAQAASPTMPGKKSPATPASAKKSATKKGTPQKKKPTAATAAAEAAEEKMQEAADEVDYDSSTGDDELDELSRKVKATLQITEKTATQLIF